MSLHLNIAKLLVFQLLAKEFMDDYIFLTVGRIGSTNDIITQKLNYVRRNDKIPELLRVLTKGINLHKLLASLNIHGRGWGGVNAMICFDMENLNANQC